MPAGTPLRQKWMQQRKSVIDTALMPVLLAVTTTLSASCASGPHVSEPIYVPTIYVTHPDYCALVNSSDEFDVVLPGTPKWNELECAPIYELAELKAKINRCEKWK